MLYDVVLGGVLSATFIPVFVDRLATRSEREAWRRHLGRGHRRLRRAPVDDRPVLAARARRSSTPSTAFGHAPRHLAPQLDQEKAVATTLLRWFVPQVAFYGCISLATALLNTRRRFVAPMWDADRQQRRVHLRAAVVPPHRRSPEPSLAGPAPPRAAGAARPRHHGRRGGPGARCSSPACDGPASRCAWRFDPRHEAVRAVLRLGGWTFGFVVANQIALFIVLALAVGVGGAAPVASYTYAYTFLQMPYAVVAVSIMSAVTPDLSERWAPATARRVPPAPLRRACGPCWRSSSRRRWACCSWPSRAPRSAPAHGAAHPGAGHGRHDRPALAMFALGLPGFCAFLYIVRVLQSMQRTRVAFWLYLHRERDQRRPGGRAGPPAGGARASRSPSRSPTASPP